jgi:DNA-binding HxlR family transcriptional regulator
MIGREKTKGIGKYQVKKAQKTIMTILRVLSDGKPHQYSELKDKTKLNSPTLSKHLKRLTKMKLIERKINLKSGKYPPPVNYTAKPATLLQLKVIFIAEHEMSEIEKIILEPKKTPLDVLDQINMKNNAIILWALEQYKENKDVPKEYINFILEIAVWEPYMVLTSHLVEASKKIVESIDIEGLQRRNKTTIFLDEIGLKELGLPENKIKDKMKKMGRGSLSDSLINALEKML